MSRKANLEQATIDALSKMRDSYEVARQRGIELSKVYEG